MALIMTTPYRGGISAFTQQNRFVSSDLEASDNFGYRVTVDSAGDTIVATANAENSNTGAAYIFVPGGSPLWSQTQKLTASDAAASSYFGSSASISRDGNTLIIGAYNALGTGGAYIFTKSGDTWSEEMKIVSDDIESGDAFGDSAAINSDGTVAIVGARGEDTGGSNTGAAYIFTKDAGSPTWTQQQKIQGSDSTGSDRFSRSVAINDAGDTVVVGANQHNPGAASAGAAYVFTESGGTWSQQQKLVPSSSVINDNFGWSCSLSADGDTAVICAPNSTTPAEQKAVVYTRSGGTWSEIQEVNANSISIIRYGYTVSLTDDGTKFVVGAWQDDTTENNAGILYVYNLDGTWSETQKVQSSPPVDSAAFGWYSAINSSLLVVSAYTESSSGAVYTFT